MDPQQTPPQIAVVGDVDWPDSGAYPIVYVGEDGSVRELTAAERQFLETPFRIDDGGRPYVMSRYPRPAWWRLSPDHGFCPRHLIPADVVIRAG